MKRMIDDKLIEFVKSLSESELTSILSHFSIENETLKVDELMLTDITFLVDEEENSFFPEINSDTDIGKVVKVASSNGFEYGEAGTKLYKHHIVATLTLVGMSPSLNCIFDIVSSSNEAMEDLSGFDYFVEFRMYVILRST